MSTMTMTSHRPPQQFHPLSLLAQWMSRQITGCVQVSSSSGLWWLFLEQGRLTFASNSMNPFDRLDRQLHRLSLQIPTLVSATRVQVRLLFDIAAPDAAEARDYQAICWLVEQQHLTAAQAAILIELMARDVLESFLALKEGSYELIPHSPIEAFPSFCRLELRPLVEYCQNQLRHKQMNSQGTLPAVVTPLPSRNNTVAIADFLKRSSESTRPSVAPVSPKPSEVLTKSTYTIACIDDSMTVLQAIKSFLDDRMFSVLMINSPVQALMQVVRNKPDLILLDVEMPNLDGYELCSLLRRHPAFKHTPIIMVTGHTGFVDRAKAKLVRASGYMTKPFTQSDLLKMVFKHLT